MKTTTNECKRCGGAGNISKFQHVRGGVCFACGKSAAPVADVQTIPQSETYSRARCIEAFATYLRNTVEQGITPAQFASLRAEGYLNQLATLIHFAPADVTARARAAYARMGIDMGTSEQVLVDY
jgi:hypothetical protein